MKNKGTKQKSKKKGSENVFGCDLIEHLQSSGQDVPQVLKKCAEFIEKYGIVDGIYRLSGVTSNIQRLRQEFCSEACPDLTKEVYLQDIHCVGSLCKLYFRELPNPLLTYELYSKFTEAVSVHGDHERLLHIQEVIKELPTPHFKTLEYLTKHLAHLATLSTQTNMHTRNLALVWAPNLLRSKDIEASSGNGDMAFQEVRKQQSVVEFILNHTEQIFSGASVQVKPKEGPSLVCGEKYATLPISGQGGPMKLMSLEEAQARSLSPNHPVHKERQRENSLPDTSTATLYHTVIDISDNKRKFSGKSKKWKSIFNLGRSVDSKGKLSRNGSVFIRAQGIVEKAALRPSRSMESLCSLPPDDDRAGSNSPTGGHSSIFIPDVKSRTLGSDSLYDLSEHDQTWEFKGKKAGGATAGWTSGINQKDLPGASAPPQKTLPEQLKVFKGDELSGYKPTSPKNRRMLYSGSSQSSSRPSFPGSFFPLESSPRHQRRAVNISEPFAVSVPLRVSAVISSNSTPCRGHSKDKAAALKPCKEPSEQIRKIGKSNTFPLLEPKKQEGTEKKSTEVLTSRVSPQDTKKEVMQKTPGGRKISELEARSWAHARQSKVTAPSSGEDQQNQPTYIQPDGESGREMRSHLHQELKITEPEISVLHGTFKPVFASMSTCGNLKLTMDVKSKRSRSSPSLSLLGKEQSPNTALSERVIATRSDPKKKQPSESDLLLCLHKNFDVISGGNAQNDWPADMLNDTEKPLQRKMTPSNIEEPVCSKQCQLPFKETSLDHIINPLIIEDVPQVTSFSSSNNVGIKSQKPEIPQEDDKISHDGAKMDARQRPSVCLEQKRNTLELSVLDDEEVYGGNAEELDLVEPWEDLSLTKQWVTSPLHSPDVEELFNQLSPFSSNGESLSSEVGKLSFPSADSTKQSLMKSTELFSGNFPQSVNSNPETKWGYMPTKPTRLSLNNSSTQSQTAKCSTTKQKNTVSSQRFYRQMSYEAAGSEKRENYSSKHRPYSLNLDLGHRCIRDISNQQNCNSLEFISPHRGSLASSGTVDKGHSELDLFLNDRQAPLRRNSAPVSVSSVRTAFMIKTCQAKAVPVIPPKVQYSQIPQSKQENDFKVVKEEKECPKMSVDPSNAAPPSTMSDPKEELENKEPGLKYQKHANVEKSSESGKTTSTPELPVITRRHIPNLEVFVDCPRPNRGNLLQRPSFRNRQRPQSLILLSPPFPIMDYPPSGDDGKFLSSIKSLNDTSAVNVFSKEIAENFRTPEGIALQNKMTIPKSGQRLETSTSCFYQPQRRSMIFDSRSHRQIE
ncbi:rho GTPase-activating protein 31 isoform X2 [Melanotaenia boesemani]|uniref:rho GTPase-activating protein 31 isoform X2 n=1 Tax=Melanotaenia boesemani TaxID=1250792 RepID=UPI001C04EB05|nr:rho GTPase-activating protein 31 isoform X2 [Melanotaenia boesemani]